MSSCCRQSSPRSPAIWFPPPSFLRRLPWSWPRFCFRKRKHLRPWGYGSIRTTIGENNLVEAIINGANSGVRLIVGIVALLLAFLGLVALMDLILGVLGGWINGWFDWEIDFSLVGLLGYVFYPFTVVIGVPLSDASAVARIIGERTVLTEVQSYQDLANLLGQNALQHPRSAVITTYALTGFAHVASLAIFVGGIAALAPKRTKDLSELGFRALLAATLACLMTAAVAGTFFTKGSILIGP